MYKTNLKDKVKELNTLPSSSVGAPIPMVIADEHRTFVAYCTQESDQSEEDEDQIAIVKFSVCLSLLFGPPNDEAFSGHPLYSAGLRPYSFFIVEDSSWLNEYVKMNEVHRHHTPAIFERYKHYILSFHDSVIECLADKYEYRTIKGNMKNAFSEIGEWMETNF